MRTLVIQPTRGLRFLNLRELWEYRELAFFLVWRDVKVRYKQTAVGILWVLLQPLSMMLLLSLVFGRLGGLQKEISVPYWLFALTGLLPWQLFSRILQESSSSLVTNQRLISKVYFPRLLIPVSVCFSALLDFAIGAGMLTVLLLWEGQALSWSLLWLPVFITLMVVTALGVGFWLSALNTEYRDVAYVVPFALQFLMFLTPVVYPSTLIPPAWQMWYGLNPMVGVLDGIRWAIFGIGHLPLAMLAVSATMGLTVFLSGIFWFRWRERVFADTLGGG